MVFNRDIGVFVQVGVISFENSLFSASQIILFSELVVSLTQKEEHVVGLATCLRHEFYFSAENLESRKDYLIHLIQSQLQSNNLPYKLFYQRECFEHLSRLMSGLESPILGESHIQNQVKKAYQTAQNIKKLNSDLHFVFQKSLKIAKFFRCNHGELLNKESLEKKVIEQVIEMIRPEEPILLIGNSDLNRNILNQLLLIGYQKIYLVSKTEPLSLAKKLAGKMSYDEIHKWGSFSGVIVATSLKNARLRQPQGSIQTKLMIDLSIPSVTDLIDLPCGAAYYDLTDLLEIVQQRQIHLKDWKIEQGISISSQVERQMILFYLRGLKKGQLLNR